MLSKNLPIANPFSKIKETGGIRDSLLINQFSHYYSLNGLCYYLILILNVLSRLVDISLRYPI